MNLTVFASVFVHACTSFSASHSKPSFPRDVSGNPSLINRTDSKVGKADQAWILPSADIARQRAWQSESDGFYGSPGNRLVRFALALGNFCQAPRPVIH